MDKIIDKIKKLHRLSKSQNPHESALARNKMEEIMYKYDISWDMVEGKKKKEAPKKENPYKPKRKYTQHKTEKSKKTEYHFESNGSFYTFESDESLDDVIDDYIREHNGYTKR